MVLKNQLVQLLAFSHNTPKHIQKHTQQHDKPQIKKLKKLHWNKLGKNYITKNNENIRNNTQPFNGPLSGTTRVSQYQKKHSLTHSLKIRKKTLKMIL